MGGEIGVGEETMTRQYSMTYILRRGNRKVERGGDRMGRGREMKGEGVWKEGWEDGGGRD